ncbi:hypothetical protein [Mucilaginibacter sp. 44-25]|uniref:hypothetical protein n=1 Tax=Mucilaginibacter sp. 44-25 TaxID=1895794 RepID=UPI0009644679|nr:hypothetical protein [Mucilaginibacter sp. 44-25]OJW14278.1 MAG: hypothetical protein BGO48_09105 [Mucilaginibacter sp. 44-25]
MLKDEMKLLAQMAAKYLLEIENGSEPSLENENEEKARISTECFRIKKSWTDLLFSPVKDHVMRRYIGFQQQIILETADSLYKQIESSKKTSAQEIYPLLKVSDFLLECLLGLKDFQLQYFNNYIDDGGKLPDAAISTVRKRMTEAAEKVSATLQNVELDVKLRACICDYLGDIIMMQPDSLLNYRSAEYLISFTETIAVTTDFTDNRDLTQIVTEALFYMNFNHHNFFQWYQETIEVRKLSLRPQDQLPMLMKQLLVLKSMPVMTSMSFDPKVQPINSQLESWLGEYIKHETVHLEMSEIELPDKIELKLTVAQLALLIRLLYEEDVFAMKNIAALLRFFSNHFMSKKQEHISYGSMNKLYYSGDQFTGYAVRELLLKMVAKVNKMFFPT